MVHGWVCRITHHYPMLIVNHNDELLIVDDVINVVDYHENYQQELSAIINMT